ncbi:replication-relaxation family protein [Armatimonas sp.]|uniref:replication-relaxation family protein n=1 Tax=Armatimonas sp. TaxID=1872638 RepID=UPI00374D066D
MNLRLQPRDLNALICTYRHGFLLRDDLHTLAFPGKTRRLMTRRIKQLVDAGLMEGEALPLGAFPVGLRGLLPHPGQFAYRITENGARPVAESIEADITLVRRRIHAVPSYVGHAVAVAKIAVALHRFAPNQGYQVKEFLCESDARYRYQWKPTDGNGGKTAGDWKTEELRPDGLAMLHWCGQLVPVHLEADMATQGRVALQAKLQAYALYASTGALRRRFPDCLNLHLGIVTTSPERVQTIQSVVAGLDAPQLSEVRITTFAQLLSDGPRAPIWSSPSSTLNPSETLKGLLSCSV